MPALSRLHRIVIIAFASLSFGGTLAAPVVLAKRPARHHKAKHRAKHRARKKCHVPQRNGADGDQDNNGGPSDGDGCV